MTERSTYNLRSVLNVLARLGYSQWNANYNVALFNHKCFDHEVMMDMDYPVLSHRIIEKKIEDMDIRHEYFDSLYEAEEKDFVKTSGD